MFVRHRLLAIAAVVAALLLPRPGGAAETRLEGPGMGAWAEDGVVSATADSDPVVYWDLVPMVIEATGAESVVVTVQTDGTVDTVSLALQAGGTLPLASAGGGKFTTTVTHGQAIQSLNRFTAGSATPCSSLGFCQSFIGFLDYYQGATRVLRGNLFISVTDDGIPPVDVADIAPGMRRTPHLVSFPWPFDHRTVDPTAVLQRFYAVFGDDYDFINIVSTPPFHENRWHFNTRNQVNGIGLPVFDNSSAYHSGGRLLGVNRFHIPTLFDLAERGSVHETGHQWGVYISQVPAMQGYSPHWPLSSMARGVMGWSTPGGQGLEFPFSLQLLPGGDYATTKVPLLQSFLDIELYLMGLLPPQEVGPHFVFANQSQSFEDGLLEGPVVPLSVADIIATYGPRLPGPATAQRHFTMASIFVSRFRPLTDREMRFFDYMAARGEAAAPVPYGHPFLGAIGATPFAPATGGRATLSTTLAVPIAFDHRVIIPSLAASR